MSFNPVNTTAALANVVTALDADPASAFRVQADARLSSVIDTQVAAQTAFFVQKDTEAYRIRQSDIVPGADNRDVLLAAANTAFASGVKEVILPHGEITLGSRVTNPGVIFSGHGDDTLIKQIAGGVSEALFYSTGTDGTKYTLAGNLAKGATLLTVPAALIAELATGSLIGFESMGYVAGVAGSNMEGLASEIRKVIAIVGTTVSVDGPLIYDYNVADSAVAWKMTPIRGVGYRNFTITSADPANITARSISTRKAQGVRISGIRIRDGGGGIFCNDVIDAVISDIEIDGLPNYGNYLGYGVAIGGRSAHILIEGLRGRNCRHLFTTLADERTDAGAPHGSRQWGGPRHVTVRGGTGENGRDTKNSYAIWDTHPYGYDIVFDNCRAFGGFGPSAFGFQVRSKGVRIVNSIVKYAGGSGIRVDGVSAEDVEISGGEIAFSANGGTTAVKNSRIRNMWIHDNVGAGIGFGTDPSGANVSDNILTNNTYGLQDASAGTHSGVVVKGNTIPKSATQSLAFVSPKSDLLFVQNIVKGYGAGADGCGGTIGGSVVRAQNLTD